MARVIIEDAERLVTKDVPESGQVYVGDDLAGSTIRLAIEVVEEADESNAQAVRDAIDRARELDDRVDELETEVKDLRREKETLMKRREQLERIEQRMATSDEIETYQRSTILSWIKNRLP